jgi:hypothetical protein
MESGINYSTAKTIVKIYRKDGRIYKKSPRHGPCSSAVQKKGLPVAIEPENDVVPLTEELARPDFKFRTLNYSVTRLDPNFWGRVLSEQFYDHS